MRWRRFSMLLFIMIFLIPGTCLAEEAPDEDETLVVRVESISEREYLRGALTNAYDVDVFSETASEQNCAVEEAKRHERQQLTDKLQLTGYERPIPEKEIMSEMSGFSLFDESGVQYELNAAESSMEGPSAFIVVAMLAGFSILGFCAAYAVGKRRRRN